MAIDAGYKFYSTHKLAQYQYLLSTIVLLYQLWEQQVRKFLYKEIRNDFEVDIFTFCDKGINEIKSILNEFGQNIEEYGCWNAINELRLLANSIKHGPGDSLKKLYHSYANLFNKDYLGFEDILEINMLIDNTLWEQILQIDEKDLDRYFIALIQFWDTLPERCFYKPV